MVPLPNGSPPRSFGKRPAHQRWSVRPHLEELEERALLSALAPPGPADPAPAGSSLTYRVGPTVNPTTTAPAAEESIAAAPGNFQDLFAAVIDFGSGRIVDGRTGLSTSKFTVSSDNGTTWVDGYIPIDNDPSSPHFGFLPTADGNFWDWNGDPVVAVDKHGTAYLSSIYSDKVTQGLAESSGLYVGVRSLAALPTTGFTAANMHPVEVDLGKPPARQVDKDWITVDNSNAPSAGTVYVSWTENEGDRQWIEVSRSTDRGRTWSAPVKVSLASQTVSVTGSQLAVGPDGTVYAAYLASPSRTSHFGGGTGQIFLAQSADGARTFSAPAAITPAFDVTFFPALFQQNSFPSLAVSPTNGNVYVAYSDQASAAAGAQVEFIRSRDGGKTFSPPVAINDVPTGQQFLPAIAVDERGVIHASWFDTRNSNSPLNDVFDVYAAFSNNDGASFGPNVRVTPASIDAGVARFVGDYIGIAAAGGFAHPVWSSGSVGMPPESSGIGRFLTGSDNSRLQTATLSLARNQPAAPPSPLLLGLAELFQALDPPPTPQFTDVGFQVSGSRQPARHGAAALALLLARLEEAHSRALAWQPPPEDAHLALVFVPLRGRRAQAGQLPGEGPTGVVPDLPLLLILPGQLLTDPHHGGIAHRTGAPFVLESQQHPPGVGAKRAALGQALAAQVTPACCRAQEATQLAGPVAKALPRPAVAPGLVLPSLRPGGVGVARVGPVVAGVFLLVYAGLGLMIRCLAGRHESARRRKSRRVRVGRAADLQTSGPQLRAGEDPVARQAAAVSSEAVAEEAVGPGAPAQVGRPVGAVQGFTRSSTRRGIVVAPGAGSVRKRPGPGTQKPAARKRLPSGAGNAQ
jgi:hypothetical protein